VAGDNHHRNPARHNGHTYEQSQSEESGQDALEPITSRPLLHRILKTELEIGNGPPEYVDGPLYFPHFPEPTLTR
jgi:hypothetical protein